MSYSNAFRSNLMQQFAASARSQARPPMALAGWLHQQQSLDGGTSSDEEKPMGSKRTTNNSRQRSIRNISTTHHVGTCNSTSSLSHTNNEVKLLSSATTTPFFDKDKERSSNSEDYTINDHHDSDGLTPLAADFQNLILTRRSRNHLKAFPKPHLKDALDRAVCCAVTAPNHKRTEPVSFKRILGPSATTERLADICYNAHMQKKATTTLTPLERQSVLSSLEQKRLKWSQVPAFLVVSVTSNTDQQQLSTIAAGPYDELAYVAPPSDRELEDYATACAATQNALLSLHAEHVATKWVTGPVVRTPAFRDLVQLQSTDRVVALILCGNATDKVYKRRYRRELYGDVLVDL